MHPTLLAFRMLCLAAAAATAAGHGLLIEPRQRGSLNTQRNIPNAVMDPAAPIDYCPHCLNCGGVGSVMKGGPWNTFAPFDYTRGGITMCGDPVGNDDHMRSGMFANPPSTPFAATYAPGSVANFAYDVTAHHNGFLQFFLCDVSATGDVEESKEFFNAHCYELERSPHPSCESGTDMDCGPIDPEFPGRWVLPCKTGKGDQVMGGDNGKMAYKIPDVEMLDAVVIAYWATANTCNPPDGFMDDYAYPQVWLDSKCPSDGGAVGARPTFRDCLTTGQVPEEFFNCADVQITGAGGGGGGRVAPRRVSPVSVTKPDDAEVSDDEPEDEAPTKPVSSALPSADARPTPEAEDPEVIEEQKEAAETYATTGQTVDTKPKASADCMKQPDALMPTESEDTCSGHWKQCGGKGYDGPVECCDKRYSCVSLNPYYSQCLTVA